MQTSIWMRGSDDVPAAFNIPSVSVYFPAGIIQVTVQTVPLDYDNLNCPADKPDEARAWESARAVALVSLFEEHLM